MPDIPAYARNMLTARELDILQRLPKTNAEISHELYITPGAVKSNIHRLLRKFDLHSRAELVDLAPRILAADAPLPKVHIHCPNCDADIYLSIFPTPNPRS